MVFLSFSFFFYVGVILFSLFSLIIYGKRLDFPRWSEQNSTYFWVKPEHSIINNDYKKKQLKKRIFIAVLSRVTATAASFVSTISSCFGSPLPAQAGIPPWARAKGRARKLFSIWNTHARAPFSGIICRLLCCVYVRLGNKNVKQKPYHKLPIIISRRNFFFLHFLIKKTNKPNTCFFKRNMRNVTFIGKWNSETKKQKTLRFKINQIILKLTKRRELFLEFRRVRTSFFG